MKLILTLSLAIAFVGQLAGATETKNCPNTLTVNYSSARVLSARQFNKTVAKSGFDKNDTVLSTWQALQTAPLSTVQNLHLKLVSTEQSRCNYVRAGEIANGDNETRIFRREGREILRVSFAVGDINYWTYHDVTSLNPTEIKVAKDSSAILGYFDHGSPHLLMGWLNGLVLEAK